MKLDVVRQYLDQLEQNPQSGQWETFVNAFTINHTAFFREQHHFNILAKFARSRKKPLSVWCCAASKGEEPYSMAMTLRESCVAPEISEDTRMNSSHTSANRMASCA